jgi:hypothetical protein
MSGCIKMLDHTGHTLTEWDVKDEASVKAAREIFDSIMARGWTVYAMDAPGSSTGAVLPRGTSFDPSVREMVAHRPLVGG